MKNLALILTLLLLVSCNNDDENNNITSETQIDLVTGINVRQDEFSTPIQLGNPNVFTNNQFITFPNPATEALSLLSPQGITDVWIVPANADKIYQETNFSSILNSDLYAETLIQQNTELGFSDLNSTNLILNLEDLSSGYYKVFVKINGSIFWENIYIAGNNFEIDDLINYWN
ncbi:hypothetical protein [Winogradskyella sp. 3972H.M.0a.05]|uniref:hypothetical protein n=1 Tax=Winogradskyella sp. 3972H.M.0a.05 TaxID=2950277 RepID=UPI0033994533